MKRNNAPSLPTPEELERERRNSYKQYLLDPREDYPETYKMFEFNGVEFSIIGECQAITGQKKNGKTWLYTMLAAVALANDSDRIREYLPGLRVPDRTRRFLGHDPRVLYVDTEMSKLSSAKVLRRVHWLCEWDMNQPNDRFNVLWLKTMPKEETVPTYEKRLEMIRLAIDDLKPDIVFIDGFRDLIKTINDEETAVNALDYFSSLAEERRMCIWLALHQNPHIGSDGELKMRGWAGTELGNKVSDTLASIKKKTPNGVTFTVKQIDARGKDMEDILFEITDDAGDLGIPKIYGHTFNAQNKPDYDEPQDILAWLNEAMTACEWPMSRNEIKKEVFGKIGKVGNHKKQQADLDYCIRQGYLKETSEKKGGHCMLELAEDLPF